MSVTSRMGILLGATLLVIAWQMFGHVPNITKEWEPDYDDFLDDVAQAKVQEIQIAGGTQATASTMTDAVSI